MSSFYTGTGKKKKKSSGQKICDRNGFIGVRLSINLQSVTNAYFITIIV